MKARDYFAPHCSALLLLTLLLCGCGKSREQAQIESLALTVETLQARCERNEGIVRDLFSLVRSNSLQLQTNLGDIFQVVLNSALDLRQAQEAIEALRTNQPVRYVPPAATAPSARSSTPLVMPANVLTDIKRRAREEWPDNFSMQDYEIKRQTEAWHRVNRR